MGPEAAVTAGREGAQEKDPAVVSVEDSAVVSVEDPAVVSVEDPAAWEWAPAVPAVTRECPAGPWVDPAVSRAVPRAAGLVPSRA